MAFSLDRFYRINRRALTWIILLALLYLMRSLFGLIFLTFVLAFLAAPLARMGQRWLRMTRRISIIATYGAFLIGIVSFATFITPRVIREAEILIGNSEEIEQKLLKVKRDVVAAYPFVDPLISGYLQTGLPDQPSAEEPRGDTQEQILGKLDSIHRELAVMRTGQSGAPETTTATTSLSKVPPLAVPGGGGLIPPEAGLLGPSRGMAVGLPSLRPPVPVDAQDERLIRFFMKRQVESLTRILPKMIKMLWTALVTMMLALLFSFLISLDISRLAHEVEQLRNSRLHDFYEQAARPVVRFGYVVGRALQAQAVIASANTVLTLVGLLILGIPSLAMLSVLVFFFSFIPVLGVFISTIPIVLLALNTGGPGKAVAAVVMIVVIHVIESYVLNPLIYGKHLKLNPVLVLMILFIGHHAFGLWGMLLGVPVAYYFIHDVFGVPVWHETRLRENGEKAGPRPPA